MSQVYVPSTIVPGAKIFAVAEAPGETEEIQRIPLVGSSGYCWNNMLSDAGLSRQEISVGNVSRFRPMNNFLDYFITDKKAFAKAHNLIPYAGKFVAGFVPQHLDTLYAEIEAAQPNVIIAMGNAALWALTGKSGISNWRASHLEGTRIVAGTHTPFLRRDGTPFKVIPTFHPAYILRAWGDRFINIQDLRRIRRESAFTHINYPDWQFEIGSTSSQVLERIAELIARANEGPLKLAADIETKARQTVCIGLAWSKTEAMCIPFWDNNPDNKNNFYSFEEELGIIEALRDLLTHPNVQIIGQNFIYDSQYIARHWGYLPRLHQDTLGSQHVCFPGVPKDLAFLASLYCEDYYRYWKDDGKEWSGKGDIKRLWSYNCEDVVRTLEIAEQLRHVVTSLGRDEQHNFQQEVGRCTLRMTLRGVRSNQALRADFKRELVEAQKNRDEYIEYVVGHPINIRSNKQMKALFYEDLRMPVQTNRKTHQPSLDDKSLTNLALKEPILKPLIAAIGERRSLGVFDSTFVSARTDGGRIYTSFNPFGPETFRFSSSKDVFGTGGNLENIPKGTKAKIGLYVEAHGTKTIAELQSIFNMDEAKLWDTVDKEADAGVITVEGKGQTARIHFRFRLPNIRKLFIPDPDFTIWDADLDRADLQIVVWEADDAELKQALREKVDLHTLNAGVLGCDRETAKMWTHGTNYGGSARTMARNCGITVHNSERMRARWFSAHPGIQAWHKRTEASLAHFGYVKNTFGYVRHYFDRPDNLLPEALAWQPQSCVAIIINTALVRIERELGSETQLLIQVHDSLVGQAPTATMDLVRPKILERMLVTVPYDDPLVISSSLKESTVSWGEVE